MMFGSRSIFFCFSAFSLLTVVAGCSSSPPEANSNSNSTAGDDDDGTPPQLGGTTASRCGNGKIEGTEQCDDFNTVGTDGCSAQCLVEPGWTCTTSGKSTCTAKCGDGLVRGAEACDDANVTSGDGCSSACALEEGYYCGRTGMEICQFQTQCETGTAATSVASVAAQNFITFPGGTYMLTVSNFTAVTSASVYLRGFDKKFNAGCTSFKVTLVKKDPSGALMTLGEKIHTTDNAVQWGSNNYYEFETPITQGPIAVSNGPLGVAKGTVFQVTISAVTGTCQFKGGDKAALTNLDAAVAKPNANDMAQITLKGYPSACPGKFCAATGTRTYTCK